MKALVTGCYHKSIEQLNSFCNQIIFLLDNSFQHQCVSSEFMRYQIEHSMLRIDAV